MKKYRQKCFSLLMRTSIFPPNFSSNKKVNLNRLQYRPTTFTQKCDRKKKISGNQSERIYRLNGKSKDYKRKRFPN